jgi:hypothetical protein
MTTFLAYLTVYGLPLICLAALLLFIYRTWYKNIAPDDAPAPLKSIEARTPEEELAYIIYTSYIQYAQNMFWYTKQWQWDFRKMADWLKPQTQSRYADSMFLRVLSECRDMDKARQDKTNDQIRKYPQRYRGRPLQPPWVSLGLRDVVLAVETVLSPVSVRKLLAMRDSLDIPPPSFKVPQI